MVRDYSKHKVIWDDANRRVIIKPKYVHSSITKSFGLGNSVIRINAKYPPTKIVQPITGETEMSGLLPTDGFGLGKWVNISSNVVVKTKKITGYNDFQADISYPEASSTTIKNSMQDAQMNTNGWGFVRIPKFKRLEW